MVNPFFGSHLWTLRRVGIWHTVRCHYIWSIFSKIFTKDTPYLAGWETIKFFGTCPNWVVSYIAYTKFHSPKPVFHSPSQIFTCIGEWASASFPAWAHLLGRGIGCLLWIQHLIDILPKFLQSFMQCLPTLDHVITALDGTFWNLWTVITITSSHLGLQSQLWSMKNSCIFQVINICIANLFVSLIIQRRYKWNEMKWNAGF